MKNSSRQVHKIMLLISNMKCDELCYIQTNEIYIGTFVYALSSSVYDKYPEHFQGKLLLGEYQSTSVMISQYWFM